LAHDVYVGAFRSDVATEREQATAARIATLAIALIAVFVGISAKGQNVAQLVGLGYAVAASANLPALVLTLYWRRCSTAGVVAGLIGGTVLSIGLVLVSPNMTYPQLQRSAALAAVSSAESKIAQIDSGSLSTTPGERDKLIAQAASQLQVAEQISPSATSIVGLSEPLIELRNPGLMSIPLGFLLVVVFSLLFPSHLSQSRWVEFAVRRETGLGAAKAIDH